MKDETMQEMLDEAHAEYTAKVELTRALAKLPDNFTRRKVLRAAAILLDCPAATGDRPNV